MKRSILFSVVISLGIFSCTQEASIGPNDNIRVSKAIKSSPPSPLLTLVGSGNPGHYVSLVKSNATHADMTEVSTHTGVTGIQKRWMWSELETSKDNYDFTEVISDLNHANSIGMKLIVFIEDRTYSSSDHPIPSYIRAGFEAPSNGGGYVGARWKYYYKTRWNLLISALASAIGSKPALEGIAFQETALGLLSSQSGVDIDSDPNNDCNCVAGTYDVDDYGDRLTEMLLHASSEFDQTRVFWYMNYFNGDQDRIGVIAEELEDIQSKNVLMGGPDILPNCGSLNSNAYPYYDEFEDRLTLFCSAQYASYEAPVTGGFCQTGQSHSAPYMTPWQIFDFAKNDLHVNYVMWNNKTWSSPANSYNIDNAYNVMAANPAFNQY